MRGKRLSVILGCALAFLMITSSTGFAQSELRVGWLQDEMLESLVCGEAWQYESQGCMFWQIVYDQAWMLGKAPNYDTTMWAAEKIETSDNIKYRYTIRENMTFHDGNPVTPKDFIFTYKHLGTSDPVWNYPDTHTVKDSFVMIDDKTFEFSMDHPHGGKYPPFNWQPILPEHLWKRYKYKMLDYENGKAVGSGPFKMVDFKPGQYMIFEKHEGHWNKDPRVDKIVFKPYGSVDARNMALKRGEIDTDGYMGVSPLAIKYFEKVEDVEVLVNPGIALVWLTFNMFMEDNGIGELAVRQAIAHAVDKERITQMIYHGYAESHDSFIYPEMASYNTELPKYDFNVEKANKILDDAGFMDTDDDGIRNYGPKQKNMSYRLLAYSSDVEIVKMSQMLREMMKPIGIEFRIQVVDLDTYYDMYYVPDEKKFDIGFGVEEPGPYADWIWEFMRSYADGGYGWNTAGYDNPEYDKALNTYGSALTEAERTELSKKMQMMMATDLPHYVIVRPKTINAVRTDKLQGYVSAMGGISNWINPWTYFELHAK